MPRIIIHSDSSNSATSVSNIFIDEYMSDANGEFVKIYLYLLRLLNAPDSAFSISSIADKFEHTEKDVKRALSYWERMHLLRLEYDNAQNLTGICLLDSSSRDTSDEAPVLQAKQSVLTLQNDALTMRAPAKDVLTDAASADTTAFPDASSKEESPLPKEKSYTADDIKNFRQNDQIAELFFITERYLGRTLTATDVNALLYLYDGLGFSADLIEYLVEYCVSKGHTSIRYIQSTAINWAENNVATVADAKRDAKLHSKAYYAVMKSFGISGRNLVPSETDFIEKWKNDYGFPLEIITEACQRTIQSVHQPSFPYADSILNSWHKRQIHNLDDIAKLDTEHQSRKGTTASNNTSSKNKFNNFDQRSYDYDQLEKILLTTNAH